MSNAINKINEELKRIVRFIKSGVRERELIMCGHDKTLILDINNVICSMNSLLDKNSLGENARRNLEIGILQDQLEKSGMFFHANHCNKMIYPAFNDNVETKIVIHFTKMFVGINLKYYFEYTSPTWQQDVLNKVKELIND